MSLLDRVKFLASERRITISQLEKKTGAGNGTIGRWDERVPGADKLVKVADFFGVSVDYLLGRTNKQDCTESIDERTVIHELEQLIFYLSNNDTPALFNDDLEIGKETHDLLIMSLEQSLRLAKVEDKIKTKSQEKLF